VLIVDGFHAPVIPLFEAPGRKGAAEFSQSAAIGVNTGVICDPTVTSIVVIVAHWPAVGVNV
jgi:hypothetical protein